MDRRLPPAPCDLLAPPRRVRAEDAIFGLVKHAKNLKSLTLSDLRVAALVVMGTRASFLVDFSSDAKAGSCHSLGNGSGQMHTWSWSLRQADKW